MGSILPHLSRNPGEFRNKYDHLYIHLQHYNDHTNRTFFQCTNLPYKYLHYKNA